MPKRLIILTYHNSMANPDIVLSLLFYSSKYLLLSLYFIMININSINAKIFYFVSYLLIS